MCEEAVSKKLTPAHKSKYNMMANKICEVRSKSGQDLKNLLINKYQNVIDDAADNVELK